MKENNIYRICLLIILALNFMSCNLKEKRLKSLFIDKVWVIDSTKMNDYISASTPFSGYILKPIKDSVFDLYKDHISEFESYKIKGDTLFLNQDKKYIPYSVEEIDGNSIRLKCLFKNHVYKNICLTNLTDLFEGKPKHLSNFYDFFTESTWYLTKVNNSFFNNEVLYINAFPDYYLINNAIKIDGDKNKFKTKFIWTENTICKFTNGSIYVFNNKTKTLLSILKYTKVNNNRIKLLDRIGFVNYEFKKIDPTLLIEERDLPLEVRLNCNEYTAEEKFRQFIKMNYNSNYTYELNSINFFKVKDCEYEYSIIRRDNMFPDIYRRLRFVVKFLENNTIRVDPVK